MYLSVLGGQEVDAELHRERQVLFRKSQELQALRLREKDAVAQLSGSRAVLASLDTRLTRLDQDSLKQQKIIYNQAWEMTLHFLYPLNRCIYFVMGLICFRASNLKPSMK